jgi:hypothetical protein
MGLQPCFGARRVDFVMGPFCREELLSVMIGKRRMRFGQVWIHS